MKAASFDLWRGNERFDQGRFDVGDVPCVAQSGPAVSSPSDHSSILRVSVHFRKRDQSQKTEIVQLYFAVGSYEQLAGHCILINQVRAGHQGPDPR